MINVRLSYNPYLVKTAIEINGKRPNAKSKLNIPAGVRLQEWIDSFPGLLTKEYTDKINLQFIGTKMDFEDVKIAFKESGVPYNLTLEEEKNDVDAAERIIDGIFRDIQKGPIDDLKTQSIKDTFNKAKSSEFEVNVVATMSSGKSTLINALLGRKLMPAKNEATTATIVKIKDVDGKKDFSATAYDKNRKVIQTFPKVTLKDMQSLNDNENVYEIELVGDIGFVSSDGMSLVLVDTPGPNNSRDMHHQEMTFKMLQDSDKSLVLFVMNGRQLGINDEKVFLDFICSNMKKGGKKSRDRYIFAVNQLDAYKPNPDDDGEDCIEKALNSVRASLNERGIVDANIFPVSAGAALEKRIDDEDEEILHAFYKKSKKYSAMRFNEYHEFTHQPLSIREMLNEELSKLDSEDKVELYTGIRNIEEAIRLYINKYARTTKICDLVLSFNNQLTELATMAKLEDSIRNDSNAKLRLKEEIQKAKNLISDSKNAKKVTDDIDSTNYTSEAIDEIRKAISDAKKQFRNLVSGKSYKVDLRQAEIQNQTIASQFNQCAAQIKVRVDNIIQSSFKNTMSNVISNYILHLKALGINPHALSIGSYSGFTISGPNLKEAMNLNKKVYDESYVVDEEYQVRIDATKGRNAKIAGLGGVGIGAAIGGPAGAAIGGLIGLIAGAISGHKTYYETKYRPKKIEKFVDYINMNEVATSAAHDFDKMLDKLEESSRKFINTENDKLKQSIKDKIKDIDRLLLRKLDDLQSLEKSDKQTSEMIEQKKKNLSWLTSIQERVNNLIEF